MSKVRVNGFGWVDIIVALDWYTKKVVGHYAGLRGTARHWLEVNMGTLCRLGRNNYRIIPFRIVSPMQNNL